MAQSWAAQSSSAAAQITNAVQSTPSLSDSFRCSVCDKGFEQRSSRDRHQRRCRQKQISGTVPRKKSCALCTQAKTRCDLLIPSCSRCRTKGLDCHYYHQPPPQHHHHHLAHPLPSRTTTLVHRRSPARLAAEEVSLPTPACTDNGQSEEFSDGGLRQHMSANNGMADVGIADWDDINHNLLEWNIFAGPTSDMELHSVCAIGNETPMTPNSSYRAPYSPNFPADPADQQLRSTPRMVSIESFKHMHKLVVESAPVQAPRHKFVFIDRVCRGYPRMMTGRNSPPPFIHSSHLIPGKMSVALANCRGLVDMYKAMTLDNRSFVMKTIVNEHRRILVESEHVRSNEVEHLGVIQAAVIYGIIRHFEKDPTFNKATMASLEAMAVNVIMCGLVAKGELDGTRPAWEDWIITESKRRTLIAMYMLHGSFNYAHDTPTYSCSTLGDILLPCTGALWQSCERSRWESEYENYLSDMRGRSLPKMADILNAESEYFTIEEWVGGMDNFGVTVLAMAECSRLDPPRDAEEVGAYGP